MPPALQPKTRKYLVAVGLVASVLLLVPFLVPLGGFIPQIEQAASSRIGEPVRISSLRLFLFPLPHLTLGGIEVGAKPYLRVRKVTVAPRLLSLLAEQKVIREIGLHGVVVLPPLLSKLPAWTAGPPSDAPAPVRVERVEIRDADLDLKGVRLREVDIALSLDGKGALTEALLEAGKGRLKAKLVPKGKEYSVELAARDWTLPAGPPLLLSSLDASGTLGKTGLVLSTISGKLYDGSAGGKLAVGWKDGWSIRGDLDIRGLEVKPVVALFTRKASLSGRLSASPVIDMRAPTAPQLAGALHVESEFKVEDGVLHDFDLAAAPRALLDKDALKGGETRFDRFSGYLIVDASGYHLIDLQIASGVLKAEGEVSISPEQKLNGVMDVAIKGTSALVSTPLAIGGTVQSPLLYPSTAALAGAAAGTALLGPGLGTTVGMKAMRMTGRLFGGKKRTPRPDSATTAPATEQPAKPPPRPAAPVEASGRR
jgi:hypothetical protein